MNSHQFFLKYIHQMSISQEKTRKILFRLILVQIYYEMTYFYAFPLLQFTYTVDNLL